MRAATVFLTAIELLGGCAASVAVGALIREPGAMVAGICLTLLAVPLFNCVLFLLIPFFARLCVDPSSLLPASKPVKKSPLLDTPITPRPAVVKDVEGAADLPEKRTMTVHRAYFQELCVQVALSENDLLQKLKANFSTFTDENRELWNLTSAEELTPCLRGEFRWIGDDPKTREAVVVWRCPTCGGEHATRPTEDEQPPDLWPCETCDALALVNWEELEE